MLKNGVSVKFFPQFTYILDENTTEVFHQFNEEASSTDDRTAIGSVFNELGIPMINPGEESLAEGLIYVKNTVGDEVVSLSWYKASNTTNSLNRDTREVAAIQRLIVPASKADYGRHEFRALPSTPPLALLGLVMKIVVPSFPEVGITLNFSSDNSYTTFQSVGVRFFHGLIGSFDWLGRRFADFTALITRQ